MSGQTPTLPQFSLCSSLVTAPVLQGAGVLWTPTMLCLPFWAAWEGSGEPSAPTVD